jgi:hypothetical protein
MLMPCREDDDVEEAGGEEGGIGQDLPAVEVGGGGGGAVVSRRPASNATLEKPTKAPRRRTYNDAAKRVSTFNSFLHNASRPSFSLHARTHTMS